MRTKFELIYIGNIYVAALFKIFSNASVLLTFISFAAKYKWPADF